MKDSTLTSFLNLGLAEPIARALVDEKYVTPTPIQSQTIPQVLAGRDVVGIAQTGTGKTAAFALPILNHLTKNPLRLQQRTCRVLVLSPTRELSSQILESFQVYGKYVRPRVALVIGGVPISRQVRSLVQGVDVLVATPGRLLDLLQQRSVHLDHVEVLVLDEADRMLDMGFIHDIRKIVAKLPVNRQTLFFSATMPKEIADLANHMLRNPVRVAVTPAATTVERVKQRVILVDRAGKPALLAEMLRNEPIDRALIFTRTKRGADRVVRDLNNSGFAAQAIHGNKSQGQRERALASFRDGHVRTLVATDIAARGIDVEGISHVVNYDLPNIPESYVHRIGRTARAGATGIAISFCDGEEKAFLRDIEKLIRISIPSTDRRNERRPAPHANGAANAQQPQKSRSNGSPNGQRPHQSRSNGSPNGQRPHQSRSNGSPNGQRPHQSRSNGSPNAKHQRHEQRGAHPHKTHGERPAAAHTGNIEAVGFLQPKHVSHPRAETYNGRRAPR
jgi:ATP-dependent RNA helicase RhlE